MKIKIRNSKELEELIMKSGYSIRGFGLAADISHTMIIQYLNGKRNPSPNSAKKITNALDKEFDSIFFIENGYKSNQSA